MRGAGEAEEQGRGESTAICPLPPCFLAMLKILAINS